MAISLILLFAMAMPASATDTPEGRVVRPRDPSSPETSGGPATAFVPGQLIVGFEPGVARSAKSALLQANGARERRQLAGRMTLVSLPPTADVRAVAARLSRQPGVRFAEPNYIYRLSATPNDPRFADLWGLHNGRDRDIDAPQAWDVTTGSSDVVVAVVDSGVDWTHPDLENNIWSNPGEVPNDDMDNDGNGFLDDVRGFDFVDFDEDPSDPNGHGTHVAGTIGAQGDNGEGMTGVNWDVSIMPVRGADEDGNIGVVEIIDSFQYACDNGAQVVNGSFGGSEKSAAVRAVIEDCPQVLFVFAAGNEGLDVDRIGNRTYPCSYTLPNIVCVAATGRTDRLAEFSNFGDVRVDIAAPGVSILSATPREVFLSDNFESGLGLWDANKASGKNWSATTESAANGSRSATDSAGQTYSNNSDTWIETANPRDLSGGEDCQLDYAFRIATQQPGDFLAVEGSKNGGSTWVVLDSGETGNLVWSGTTAGFIEWSEFIEFDGFDDTPSVDLRFRLVSDSSGRRDGAWVDDVILHCMTGNHGDDDFVRFQGTSMATPHVAGVAALMLAEYPSTTPVQLKAALLAGADRVAALDGKVASGGRLNARGALDQLENVAPVAFKPTVRLMTGKAVGRSTIPLKVSWQEATDAAPSSGIDGYQVQARTRQGGTWGAWQTVARTATRSTVHSVRAGTHQVRLRAQDRAGNWSAWRTAAGPIVLKDPQGSSNITFHRSWSTATSSDFYEGKARYAQVTRATATHSFTGSQVAWVASRGPNRGRAEVFVDGVLAETVDLYAASRKDRRVVFLQQWASTGAHSIRIKVIGPNPASSGKRVDLDAYLTLAN